MESQPSRPRGLGRNFEGRPVNRFPSLKEMDFRSPVEAKFRVLYEDPHASPFAADDVFKALQSMLQLLFPQSMHEDFFTPENVQRIHELATFTDLPQISKVATQNLCQIFESLEEPRQMMMSMEWFVLLKHHIDSWTVLRCLKRIMIIEPSIMYYLCNEGMVGPLLDIGFDSPEWGIFNEVLVIYAFLIEKECPQALEVLPQVTVKLCKMLFEVQERQLPILKFLPVSVRHCSEICQSQNVLRSIIRSIQEFRDLEKSYAAKVLLAALECDMADYLVGEQIVPAIKHLLESGAPSAEPNVYVTCMEILARLSQISLEYAHLALTCGDSICRFIKIGLIDEKAGALRLASVFARNIHDQPSMDFVLQNHLLSDMVSLLAVTDSVSAKVLIDVFEFLLANINAIDTSISGEISAVLHSTDLCQALSDVAFDGEDEDVANMARELLNQLPEK